MNARRGIGYLLASCVSLVLGSAACGAPGAGATTTGPSATGAPCGITPQEMAAPVASGANYVPPAPSPSGTAGTAPSAPRP